MRARLLIPAAAAVLATAVPAAAVTSQGAFRAGADAYWSRGITGAGQDVAVLDQGFGGLDASIGAGELPPREALTIQTFDARWGTDGHDAMDEPTQHGTRMAEIVHDMAPDARLVLVNYNTEEEFLQAVDWITANGIPIVSHSNSFISGIFDGTGRMARAVDQAAGSGVLWVNSSGNFARRHWSGTADASGTVVPIQAVPNLALRFGIGWRGVPGIAARVEVQRQAADGSWEEVGRTRSDLRTPVIPVDGGTWRLVVRQLAGPGLPLDVFSRTIGFGDLATPAGSVATPGDAAGSLTVGAVPWTGDTLADYSSYGPLPDGRQKPELVAPTYVTANPAWPGTAGTSAATAHVAGAAALVRQERQGAGLPVAPDDLRADLLARTRDIGPPGPDPQFGAGMMRLDVAPPAVRMRLEGRRRPVASVRVSDDGTVASLALTLNGRPLRRVAGPRAVVRLPRLPRARNVLVATATDLSGNVASRSAVVRG